MAANSRQGGRIEPILGVKSSNRPALRHDTGPPSSLHTGTPKQLFPPSPREQSPRRWAAVTVTPPWAPAPPVLRSILVKSGFDIEGNPDPSRYRARYPLINILNAITPSKLHRIPEIPASVSILTRGGLGMCPGRTWFFTSVILTFLSRAQPWPDSRREPPRPEPRAANPFRKFLLAVCCIMNFILRFLECSYT